jgi:hypothetical protein
MTETETGYAEGWKPSPGDRVQGVVTDVTATDGGYGVYPVVTLRTPDGSEVAVHAFHTVLRKELARRRPGVGDELDITYLGKKSGGRSDRGYDAYRVKSSKDAPFNWDSELSGEEREAWASDEPPIESAPLPQPADPTTQFVSDGDKFGSEPPF